MHHSDCASCACIDAHQLALLSKEVPMRSHTAEGGSAGARPRDGHRGAAGLAAGGHAERLAPAGAARSSGRLPGLAGVAIWLFMFHGCHRLLHSLHDLRFPRSRLAPWLSYGAALLASLVAAVLLQSIGG
jgi:hypothetical protein